MRSRHFLENRLPPLLVAFIVGAVMAAAARLTPALAVHQPALRFLAWGLVILGASVALAGVVTFRRHRTTVNPFKPGTASTLVESGIYRRTRNPMYVGVTLALLGFAAWRGHPLSLVLVALFPAFIQRFQIAPEERALGEIFGPAYAAYKTRVPRWL
mgnify:CR=1 FL=1